MNLETQRLILRPIAPEDKNEVFQYRRDPVANQYQDWIPNTVEEVAAFIAKVSKEIKVPGTWFQFVIIEKETQQIIGDIGIHFIDKELKQSEIGCTLNKDFQNRGFAGEAIRKVIDYLFRELKQHRIIASIDPNNNSSIKLLESIGFRKEAHFVESLWIHGKWVDDLIYAMIEKDWENIHGNL